VGGWVLRADGGESGRDRGDCWGDFLFPFPIFLSSWAILIDGGTDAVAARSSELVVFRKSLALVRLNTASLIQILQEDNQLRRLH